MDRYKARYIHTHRHPRRLDAREMAESASPMYCVQMPSHIIAYVDDRLHCESYGGSEDRCCGVYFDFLLKDNLVLSLTLMLRTEIEDDWFACSHDRFTVQ